MNIIIIGAGAAGLMAGKHLSAAGHAVQILEARDRLGGRIHSFTQAGSNLVCEAGAEFIHGNLPVTIDLLKEAGIAYEQVSGDMWEHFGNRWQLAEEEFEGADLVEDKLSRLTDNISMKEFLEREFGDEKYAMLRQSLLSYIEGYFAADPSRTSALQFYKEWSSEDEEQYHLPGSYSSMINYLAECISSKHGNIRVSTVVKKIDWSNDPVRVTDAERNEYVADKVLITIPLGVWQSKDSSASISFLPSLPQKLEAAQQLGFGNVIKILLHFKTAFWKEHTAQLPAGKDLQNMSFIFSDEAVPTYWTRLPQQNALLTGWLAGPKSTNSQYHDETVVLNEALSSLASIFDTTTAALRDMLSWSKVFNWNTDPYTLGGYTYSTLEFEHARKALLEPVENKLFFAGEGLYEGMETGTVEAALTSGIVAAQQIIASARA